MNSVSRLKLTVLTLLVCFLAASCGQSSRKGEALVRRAYAGDIVGVKRLIHDGADVNYRTKRSLRGDTALTAAVRQRNTAVVDYLLQSGADPNVGDSQDFSPLYLALASPGDAGSIVKSLILAGANTDSVKATAQQLGDNDPNKSAYVEAVREKTQNRIRVKP